jgi:hypothetical protein
MYKTLKQAKNGSYTGNCPTCRKSTEVGPDLQVREKCEHFVRRWRVAEDGRVRVEYRDSQLAGV